MSGQREPSNLGPSSDEVVTLRPMNGDDARRISGGVRPLHGWAPEFPDFGDRASVTHWRATPTSAAPWAGSWLIWLGDVVVGTVGFKEPPRDGFVEVGYGVVAPVRGRGVATAALTQLLKMVDGPLEIVAETSPTNAASAAVLTKAGFRLSGKRVDESGGELLTWRRVLL